MSVEDDIAMLAGRIAELEAKLQTLDAHGLSALQFGYLADHPVRYVTAAPTTSDMTANGQIRVGRVAGSSYIYARSNGAIGSVLLS